MVCVREYIAIPAELLIVPLGVGWGGKVKENTFLLWLVGERLSSKICEEVW